MHHAELDSLKLINNEGKTKQNTTPFNQNVESKNNY